MIATNSDTDIIIVDIMMPPGEESEFETKSGFAAGLTLINWLKNNYNSIRIAVFSNVEDEEFFSVRKIPFIKKYDTSPHDLVEKINYIISGETYISFLRTFIVHGHDDTAKYHLKNYLP